MYFDCVKPKLYNDFECTADKCYDDCCHGWTIFWSKSEYEKLLNASSPELRATIGKSFVYSSNDKQYKIVFSDGDICPFLLDNKLCAIQRELGAQYLSSVCMTYPRVGYVKEGNLRRVCTASCCHVMEMLINDENAMKLMYEKEVIHSIDVPAGIKLYSKDECAKNPAMEYRFEILDYLYSILSSDEYSIETGMVLGALAAHQLTKYESNGQTNKIPNVITALTAQPNNKAQIEKIENIKQNYSLSLSFVNTMLSDLYSRDVGLMQVLKKGGDEIADYEIGLARFKTAHPFAIKNIALNFLYDSYLSSYSIDHTIYDNYTYFLATVASIKLVAASIYFANSNPEMDFPKISSYICRMLYHKMDNINTVLNFLKANNATSPAYLAYIIK